MDPISGSSSLSLSPTLCPQGPVCPICFFLFLFLFPFTFTSRFTHPSIRPSIPHLDPPTPLIGNPYRSYPHATHQHQHLHSFSCFCSLISKGAVSSAPFFERSPTTPTHTRARANIPWRQHRSLDRTFPSPTPKSRPRRCFAPASPEADISRPTRILSAMALARVSQ